MLPSDLCPNLSDVAVVAKVRCVDGSVRSHDLAPEGRGGALSTDLPHSVVSGRFSTSYEVTCVTPDGEPLSVQSGEFVYEPGSASSPALPFSLYQTTMGVAALAVGFVAVGLGRKQRWAKRFATPIGVHEKRIRGYLKRTQPSGVQSAHANIGLENPGLPNLTLGTGTPCLGDLRNTVIEIMGTTGGSPPIVRVERGTVKIQGEEVDGERQLEDGDLIELEGRVFTYLRGGRK